MTLDNMTKMNGAYREITHLVVSRQVSITFIMGLARGGTTAIERHLYVALEFDANVNEPTLSGPESCWEMDDRTRATASEVKNDREVLKRCVIFRAPLTNTHCWGPHRSLFGPDTQTPI